MKKYCLIIILVFLGLYFLGCANKEIQILNEQIYLEINESYEIKKDVDYKLINIDDVSFANSDNDVISLTDNIVVGLEIGNTSVVIRSGEIEAYIEFIIIKKAKTLNITGPNSVNINDVIELSCEVSEDISLNLEWKSYNESIATVFDGVVTGVSAGVCDIVVRDLITSLNAQIKITVTNYQKTQSLKIEGINQLYINETSSLSAIFDNNSDVMIKWSSSSNILEIDNEGNIKCIGEGVTIITCFDEISKLSDTITIDCLKKDEDIVKDVFELIEEKLGKEGYDDANLIKKHPKYNCLISWETDHEEFININTGVLAFIPLDEAIKLHCTVTYGNIIEKRSYDYTVLGYILEDISEDFEELFKNDRLYSDVNMLITKSIYEGTTITVKSGDLFILSEIGEFHKPFNPTYITITYTIKTTEPSLEKKYTKELLADGMTVEEKSVVIKEWINNNIIGPIDKHYVFPTSISEYECTLEWLDSNGGKLDLDIDIDNPILNDNGVYIDVLITIDNKQTKLNLYYEVENTKDYTTWELIELYINTIANFPLTTYKYQLYTWKGTNLGYIPFTVNTNAEVTVDILPYTYGKQRTGIVKASTEYIVIHDTGNGSIGADGKTHAKLIANYNNNPNSEYISWHYSIDDERSYQHLPLDEVAYHAGDGSRVFGDTYVSTNGVNCIGGGNRNGIGIESCIDEGSDYTQTMRNMAKVVAELLIDFKLGFDRIKQHYNFNGKNCPQVMRGSDRWNEFLFLVRLEYFIKTTIKDVTLEWTSLSNALNNNGQIISELPLNSSVNYKVKATFNGESKEFLFTSTLKGRS